MLVICDLGCNSEIIPSLGVVAGHWSFRGIVWDFTDIKMVVESELMVEYWFNGMFIRLDW